MFYSLLMKCFSHSHVSPSWSLSVRFSKVVRGALDRNGGSLLFSQTDMDMYLSSCKFLDTALAFPPERMPLFQM